ncbi:hypothetical protein Glove_217g184 [Diversispora epigaea]|uniref:HCP-like protein n=1 Tax=Diversispora epigaea TaxID=1348612 RepID=A0A397IH02_9GLOM|nr:hypothetical protein Glove_217g184 [Diversispora epigaea]
MELGLLLIFHKLANRGFLFALNSVVYCHDIWIGVKEIEKEHLNIFKICQKSVGWYYGNGMGVGKDEKAFKWYLKAAEKEHKVAQYNLGICYVYGFGINNELVKSFKCFKKDAENDDESSQYKLGNSFNK